MLSRAFNERKSKRSQKYGEGCSQSQSHHEAEEDGIVGLMGDLPLSFCWYGGPGRGGAARPRKTLKEVVTSSVQVIGDSGLGISEKVVMSDRAVYAAKRFKRVIVGGGEFGRRVERLAHVSRRSEYLVPVRAYLYAKRIKFVLCDYYPMGSLSDLLSGARQLGHTPLDWDQRLKIVLHVARAIAFIHTQSPPQEKHLLLNVHGNIKSSNVLIKTDFSACLSDYGFVQLAAPMSDLDEWQQLQKPQSETVKIPDLSQKNDIYSFGVIVLDMLGGPKAPTRINHILERKEDIKQGVYEFFELFVEGKERKQALQVLDLALACTNRSPEARPSIDQILLFLGDVLSTG